ncbi:migration and invasion-inhibitory protein isoform X5 [Ahaetulla prasina]|uniref:migration and invasion-inhibitory protein isoform X5 n=1 Tax=Ahaetulla prasina TaxID=499056 RepID=UPI002648662D|nr:migration and invasion-inhibitory protein isoform X5 [Ahaetulla prasina]
MRKTTSGRVQSSPPPPLARARQTSSGPRKDQSGIIFGYFTPSPALERDVARRRQSSLPGSLPDFGKPEMDLQQLRHLNQDLLQRLKANQEEFRKCLPFVMPSPSATPERKRMLSSGNRIQPPFGPDLEGATLNVSETRNSQLRLDSLRSERRKEGCSPSWGPPRSPCMVVVPSLEAGSGNGETAKEDAPQKPPTASCPELKERTGAREELTQNPAEEERRQGTSARMPQTPKSILLTPGGKHGRARKKKEAGHVTFVSDTEEPLISADSMSAQPFLGYDWIAGLLETDTSLSEKPEEYFAELQNFRQVNKEACIRDHGFELEDVNSSALDQEMETEAASHQCVFCYRLNKRLFTVPMDPESACPVCKTPRAEKPPETLVEPAFVRVSFPRATLLPAYKHKIHRRKSYEMEDNLALPSHCLAGWENPVRVSSPIVSSLDLHSSLDSRRSHQAMPTSTGTTGSPGCACASFTSRPAYGILWSGVPTSRST